MSPTMRGVGIDRLSIPERILLAEPVWDRIAGSPEEVDLTGAPSAEPDRRLAAHEADPQAGSTWAEVRAGHGAARHEPEADHMTPARGILLRARSASECIPPGS